MRLGRGFPAIWIKSHGAVTHTKPTIQGTPGASIGVTSITIPTHAANDLILICAYNDAGTTSPGAPAAGGTVPTWNTIDAPAGANGVAMTTAWATAAGTNDTSGTWTNTSDMAVICLRGQSIASPIGGHGISSASALNQVVAPSITLTRADGSSFVVEFFGYGTSGSNFSAWSAAPSGYTQQASAANTTHGICLDTENTTTSAGSVTQTGSGGIGSTGTFGTQIEILAA